MTALFTWLSDGLNGAPWLAVLAAAGWGVASLVLSPCHLASIPLVVGFIAEEPAVDCHAGFELKGNRSIRGVWLVRARRDPDFRASVSQRGLQAVVGVRPGSSVIASAGAGVDEARSRRIRGRNTYHGEDLYRQG